MCRLPSFVIHVKSATCDSCCITGDEGHIFYKECCATYVKDAVPHLKCHTFVKTFAWLHTIQGEEICTQSTHLAYPQLQVQVHALVVHHCRCTSIPEWCAGLSRGAGGPARRCPAVCSRAACPRRSSSSCGWGGAQGGPWGAVQGLPGPQCAGL